MIASNKSISLCMFSIDYSIHLVEILRLDVKKTQSRVHCFGKGNLLLIFGLKIHKIVVVGLQLFDYSDSSKTKLRSVLSSKF